MRVEEIMSTRVRTIRTSDPATMASERMRINSIRHLIAMHRDRIAGVVSARDVTDLATEDREFRSVEDVMSSPAVVVAPHISVDEASGLMAERGVSFLPVVQGEVILGSIALEDLANALLGIGRPACPVEMGSLLPVTSR
jgi:CBS domain-containing protein